MGANFLYDLALCKEVVIYDGTYEGEGGLQTYSEDIKHSLLNLIDYVRGGTWCSNDTALFIAQHFDVKQSELPNVWKSVNPDSKPKSGSTWRTSHQSVNKILSSIFDVELTDAYIGGNFTLINKINNTLDAVKVAELQVDSLLGSSLSTKLRNLPSTYKKFEIDDCKDVITTLAYLSKTNMDAIFENQDRYKLAYVYDLLTKQPFVGGKINGVRLELLKYFSKVIEHLQNTNLSNAQATVTKKASNTTEIDEKTTDVVSTKTETLKDTVTTSSNDDFIKSYVEDVIVPQDSFLNPDVIKFIATQSEEYKNRKLKSFDKEDIAYALQKLSEGDEIAMELYNETVNGSDIDSDSDILGDFVFLPTVLDELYNSTEGMELNNEMDGDRLKYPSKADCVNFLSDYTYDTFIQRLELLDKYCLLRTIEELKNSTGNGYNYFIASMNLNRKDLDERITKLKQSMLKNEE